MTARQRESLITAAIWAAKNIRATGAIPRGAISQKHWDRFLELGLAACSGQAEFVLTPRGAELAANIDGEPTIGQPIKGLAPRETILGVRLEVAERAAVDAYAARKGVSVSEVVREGLRAVGALS